MKMTSMVIGMVLGLSAAANASFVSATPDFSKAVAIPVTTAGTDDDPFMYLRNTTLSTGTEVDFYSIDLTAGQSITVTTTPLSPRYTTPNTLLGLYAANGTSPLVLNDDVDYANNQLGSTIFYTATADTTYYVGVTGSGDTDFDGYVSGTTGHGQVGKYQILVSVVPEPATLAILAFAGLGTLLRKRR